MASEGPKGSAFPTASGKPVALQPEAILKFIQQTVLFSDAGTAFGIAESLEAVEFAVGETIIPAGTAGDSMGMLARGRASVASVNPQTGELSVIEALRPPDHFGEIGLLLGVAQPHAIVADEPCIVLHISKEVFQSLVARVPSFARALAQRLAMRVVQMGLAATRPGGPMSLAPQAAKSPSEPSPGPDVQITSDGTIPFVEIADFEPPPNVLAVVPERIILQQRVLPLQLKENQLIVGMVAPRNEAAITELKRVLHRFEFKPVAISQDDYQHALVRFRLVGKGDAKAELLRPDALAFDVVDSEREADKAVRVVGDEVVRTVNKVLCAGLEREASDIHIEPELAGVKVRFRVHGVLHEYGEHIAPSFARGIVARLKILSGLDITERRLPQDGRIGVNVGRREVDMRIATLPASRGEKVTLRIFEAATMMRSLDLTFMDKNLAAAVRNSLGRTTGAIIVGGGTNSGKSTTLYTMLGERRKIRPDSNVVMVEDPIEYRLQGVTQVQVNYAVGLGFARALRSILRQDPDVIALGETRDAESAQIALEAAMTGHLLLTSLHANNALSAIQRLETLGCPRELIAQSLSLVLVQRLVRRLCPSCARAEPPAPIMQESLVARKLVEPDARTPIPRAIGCDGCGRSGYLGRIAVVEALQVNDKVRNAIMVGLPLSKIEEIALQTSAYMPFNSYAAHLMGRNLISGADALMAVAE